MSQRLGTLGVNVSSGVGVGVDNTTQLCNCTDRNFEESIEPSFLFFYHTNVVVSVVVDDAWCSFGHV